MIPTKNRHEQLKRATKNFLNNKKLKLIIIDDGSNKMVHEKNKNFFENKADYFYFKESRGAPHARNYGASLSKSEYIWFFDDDDEASEETIKKLIEYLKNKRYDMLILPMAIIENGVEVKKVIPDPNKNNFEYYKRKGHQVNTSCVVIHREKFNQVKGWDEDLVAGQDTDLFLRLSEISEIKCLNNLPPVKVYTSHPDRMTLNAKKQMKAKIQFLKKNKNRLSFTRKLYYLFTYIFMIPYLKKIIYKPRS